MADLLERLYTKDKDSIIKSYKRIKKYASRLGIQNTLNDGMVKDIKLHYLAESLKNERILMALINDITLSEFYDFLYFADMNFDLEYKGSDYWYDMGLSYYIEYSDKRFFKFSDEIQRIFKNKERKMYNKLSRRAVINSCVAAMTNLYGVISFENAYKIFSEIDDKNELVDAFEFDKEISFQEFCDCAISFADMREEFNVAVYLDSFVSRDYVKISTRNCVTKVNPLPSFYELLNKQGNKPFYSEFSIYELLEFEYPDSYGKNDYVSSFLFFLESNFNKPSYEIIQDLNDICISCRNETGINDIFIMLDKKGLMSKSQKLQKSIVCHIMEIKNNIRLRSNRGFSINEIRLLSYDMDRACSSL